MSPAISNKPRNLKWVSQYLNCSAIYNEPRNIQRASQIQRALQSLMSLAISKELRNLQWALQSSSSPRNLHWAPPREETEHYSLFHMLCTKRQREREECRRNYMPGKKSNKILNFRCINCWQFACRVGLKIFSPKSCQILDFRKICDIEFLSHFWIQEKIFRKDVKRKQFRLIPICVIGWWEEK